MKKAALFRLLVATGLLAAVAATPASAASIKSEVRALSKQVKKQSKQVAAQQAKIAQLESRPTATGIGGPAGPQGPKGDAGARGTDGPRGFAGPPGEPGESCSVSSFFDDVTGQTGASISCLGSSVDVFSGRNGTNGDSCTVETALDEFGKEGSQITCGETQSFVSSGERGPQGPQGDQGPPGPPGSMRAYARIKATGSLAQSNGVADAREEALGIYCVQLTDEVLNGVTDPTVLVSVDSNNSVSDADLDTMGHVEAQVGELENCQLNEVEVRSYGLEAGTGKVNYVEQGFFMAIP